MHLKMVKYFHNMNKSIDAILDDFISAPDEQSAARVNLVYVQAIDSLDSSQIDALFKSFCALPEGLRHLGYRLDLLLSKLLKEHKLRVLSFVRVLAFLEQKPDNGLFRLPLVLQALVGNENNSLGTALTMWLSSKDIRDVRLAMAFEDPRICRLKFGMSPYVDLKVDEECLELNDQESQLVRIVYRALGTYNLEHILAVRMTVTCLEKLELRTLRLMKNDLYEALCLNHVVCARQQLDAMPEGSAIRKFLEPLVQKAEGLLKTVHNATLCRELSVGTQERAVAFRRNLRMIQRARNAAMKESLTALLFGEPKCMLYGGGAMVPQDKEGNLTFQEHRYGADDQHRVEIELPILLATHGLRLNLNGTLWRIRKDFIV